MKLSIGRDPSCELVLDSPLVSRFHAQFEQGRLRDLNSANGTFVDGVSIQECFLAEGQTVTIGPYHLDYRDGALVFAGRGLAVECRDLTYRPPGYPTALLENIHLKIEPGTFIAIVGTSGAGKSTLMKLLAGLVPLTSGQVTYNGRPRDSSEFRKAVGWVPQDEIVHAHLPVKTALTFSARLRLTPGTSVQELERRVYYAADQVNLNHRLDTPIRRLSGGERKRVALAAEELGDPDVFFLDEPTSGLDPGMEKDIMLSLRDLARRGRTVILITHATDNIKLCDRLLFLAPGGHPVFCDSPEKATEHFGVEDFAEIYRLLTNRDWYPKVGVEVSRQTRLAMRAELSDHSSPTALPRDQPLRKGSPLSQLRLLVTRELYLTRADRSNTLLTLLQAPIIAILLGQLFPAQLFELTQHLDSQAKYPVMEAPTLLFMMIVSSLFFGAVNSCREFVKERTIYRRERLLGVRPELYLLSKVLVLGAKGLFSVAVLILGVALLLPLPWTLSESLEALWFCWATYLGGVGLGLSLSALAGTSEQSSTLVTVVLILQLMLSGAFVKPEQMSTPLAELSVLSVCRWGFAGLAHLSEINQRFSELGLPFVTADFYFPATQINGVLIPLVGLHLVLPLLFLALRKDHDS